MPSVSLGQGFAGPLHRLTSRALLDPARPGAVAWERQVSRDANFKKCSVP